MLVGIGLLIKNKMSRKIVYGSVGSMEVKGYIFYMW